MAMGCAPASWGSNLELEILVVLDVGAIPGLPSNVLSRIRRTQPLGLSIRRSRWIRGRGHSIAAQGVAVQAEGDAGGSKKHTGEGKKQARAGE
jgi:hypothetical protein